jgi:predicted aspartyl protease
VFLTVPQHIAVQLGFDTEEARTREVILADGSRKAVPMILKNAFDRVQSSYMSGRLWA